MGGLLCVLSMGGGGLNEETKQVDGLLALTVGYFKREEHVLGRLVLPTAVLLARNKYSL